MKSFLEYLTCNKKYTSGKIAKKRIEFAIIG